MPLLKMARALQKTWILKCNKKLTKPKKVIIK